MIARCIEIFVERKRLCGYDYNSSAKILRRFAASVGAIDVSRITEKHIEAFLGGGQLSHNLWRRDRSLIGRFLAYWFAGRQISRVPEPRQKPPVPTRFFPYVYSRAEISRLLAAAPPVSQHQSTARSVINPERIYFSMTPQAMRAPEFPDGSVL